jgi:hypothetical protein
MPDLTSLEIRKIADKSDGERVVRFHPESGNRYLADPETLQPKPWPLAGIELRNLPKQTQISQSFAQSGIAEGWLELRDLQLVHRPGGPPEDPWRVTHTFFHADAVVFKTVNGDVVYKVQRQPDKYALHGVEVLNEETGTERRVVHPTKKVTPEAYANGETEVAWYYILKLEEAPAETQEPSNG